MPVGAMPYSRYLLGNLPWYSVLMVIGILTAYLIGNVEQRRLGLPRDAMLDITLVTVPCGIVGARIYYVLLSLDKFRSDPLSVFYIWEGGIAMYGSVIGGLIGLFIYAKKKKLSALSLMDMAAPGLLLAQAIGRWGNYFNMEAYGPVVSSPAWQFFPFAVLIPEGGGTVWHMAAFFYESMWNLAGFFALMAARRRLLRAGDMFLWYMAIYGSGRFLIEQLRVDSLYLGDIRFSQYLSLALCLTAGITFLIRAFSDKRREAPMCLALVAAAFLRFALRDEGCFRPVMLPLFVICAALLAREGFRGDVPRAWPTALYFALLTADALMCWLIPRADTLTPLRACYSIYLSVTLPIYLARVYMNPTKA